MSEHCWGVDVAISHLAFGFADLGSDDVQVESLITRNDTKEGERLGLLDRQVRIYARQAAGRYPPACVWVEQASGRWRAPQLVYAVGVVQAALAETLRCPVWSIPSGKWKKWTLGVGNATKPQVARHVANLRLNFDGQDEADAICIAMAGREIFKTGRWESAA